MLVLHILKFISCVFFFKILICSFTFFWNKFIVIHFSCGVFISQIFKTECLFRQCPNHLALHSSVYGRYWIAVLSMLFFYCWLAIEQFYDILHLGGGASFLSFNQTINNTYPRISFCLSNYTHIDARLPLRRHYKTKRWWCCSFSPCTIAHGSDGDTGRRI